MSRLYDEVSALMRTGTMFIVDTETGTFDEFTAEEFVVVSDMLTDGRFQARLSLKSAIELCHKSAIERARKN